MYSTDCHLAAVQVDIPTLVSNFEAYVNLLPVISTLRLCHRFGKDAAITKLPTELVRWIEDSLTYEERLNQCRSRHQNLRCHQHLCDPIEHCDEEAYRSFYHGKPRMYFHEHQWGVSETEIERMIHYEKLVAEFEHDPEYWDYVHDYFKDSWLQRVSMENRNYQHNFTSPFKVHKDILKRHFQLEVWTTNLRLDDSDVSSYWERHRGQCSKGANTTLGYIIVPSDGQNVVNFDFTEREYEDGSIDVQSGGAMKINLTEALSQSRSERFRRMVKILGLKPITNTSQSFAFVGQHNGGKGANTKVVDTVTSSWPTPELMVLLKHDVSF